MDILSFLQQQGISRRNVIQFLQEQAVFKNNIPVEHRKELLQDGDIIIIKRETQHLYQFLYEDKPKNEGKIILFHKPIGVVVSKSDTHNKTVYDILPKKYQHYNYMGRLDKDSHGLLVLTNIMPLISHFSHPRYQHSKTYLITTKIPLSSQDIQKGIKGVSYFDKDINKTHILSWESCELIKQTTYKVVLQSGKKRHLRRLCELLGNDIIDLQRVQFGPWSLDIQSKPGEYQEITLHSEEIENLLKS